ncbi:auxin response factor 18 [Senna tora]|uniref:Auxin response factor n=1 Tax=Senna tora TaxID=362788 RepID=A0A834TJK4_9FABA|nr:auxin response factor 18 [Senna tora]
MKESEKSLDPQLWHACAGGMVQIPPVNSRVFYFPQGHAEHAQTDDNNLNNLFSTSLRIPPLILCRVASVRFLADPKTDEVFAKMKLIPTTTARDSFDDSDDGVLGNGNNKPVNPEKPSSFAKTLTQSDANNGGGFSVPRYCAETIFPRLDYSAEPPVQTVSAKDVHGETWKFRHIYRGTPRRHLLTTGWSTFVNQKKLIAGDSIVFLRAENGDLRLGIRRAKRGFGGRPETGWTGNCGGLSCFLREEKEEEEEKKKNRELGSVMEAVRMAARGEAFEVVYYPRGGTPEFCVKAACVREAMRTQWCGGMRFKMAFETEDSCRISWFMGTIASVQVIDPMRWPNSPWRLLQHNREQQIVRVSWDEPDLLQNVKRVSPWLVELVSNMPAIHLTPFSTPRKKLRLLDRSDFPFNGPPFSIPMILGNPLGRSSPLCCLSDNAPAGIQGARHAQFGISLSDLHLNNNKLQLGLLPTNIQVQQHPRMTNGGDMANHGTNNESLSCLLTVGNSCKSLEKSDNMKRHRFLLFGQPILTEQQISRSLSGDNKSSQNNNITERDFLDENNRDKAKFTLSDPQGKSSSVAEYSCWQQLGLDSGHCKVFMESEDVGRTLDLSHLGSYEELYRRLANMFAMERSRMFHHVLYCDATGAVKKTGQEPFSDFMKTAKRLTILTDSASKEF